MEVLFAIANIAAEILWTAIPYFVEFMFKELLSHVCFLMLHLNICGALSLVFKTWKYFCL